MTQRGKNKQKSDYIFTERYIYLQWTKDWGNIVHVPLSFICFVPFLNEIRDLTSPTENFVSATTLNERFWNWTMIKRIQVVRLFHSLRSVFFLDQKICYDLQKWTKHIETEQRLRENKLCLFVSSVYEIWSFMTTFRNGRNILELNEKLREYKLVCSRERTEGGERWE